MPADYLTTITGAPDVEGLEVAVVEGGSRLELRWSAPGELVVLGTGGEPFLRLTPEGVESNRDSPDHWLTQDRRGTTEVPEGVDGRGAPDWERTSDEPVARWHEHRAHWTGTDPPEVVQDDPDARHRVADWVVPLRVDGAGAEVTGTLDYLPGPSGLPWGLVALAVGVGAVLAQRAGGRVAAAACLVVLAADVVRALGTGLSAADRPAQALLEAMGIAGVGWVLLAVAAVGLLRGRLGAVVLVAVGGAVVALAGATPEVGTLTASLPLSQWPDAVQRAAVAVGLGGGLGLLGGLVAAFRQLSERDAVEPEPAPA